MKKIFWLLSFLFLTTCTAAWAQQYPSAPEGYVNDFAGVIHSDDKEYLSNLARELEDKTTDQLAIVTINTTQPETIEGYAVELFKRWGIGQKGKDNGVLLLVAVQDHKVRIENGYGLEGTLTDVLSNKIIRDILVPAFKSGQYSRGIKEGATAIVSIIASANGITITGQESRIAKSLENDNTTSPLEIVFFILFMIFVFRGFFLPFLFSGWSGDGYGNGGFSGGGGGFGGGFGGFGGGMSGGGGSSGSW